jgi:hypothetical protein
MADRWPAPPEIGNLITMLVVLLVWCYIALLLAAAKWPDIPAMLGSFALYGGLPAALLVIRIRGRGSAALRARQQQRIRGAPSAEAGDSVHGGVDDVNKADAGNDQH